MTKTEKYDALKKKGVELKHINNHSSDEIDALYKQHFGSDDGEVPTPPEQTGSDQGTGNNTPDDTDKDDASKKVPPKRVLEFATSGWCEELKMSYRKGVFHPKSEKEYEALKKYAIQEK